MKLLTMALCALVSTTLAVPIEQGIIGTTNLAVECRIRPNSSPIAATLCAEVDWKGYCHEYVTCEGSCFDIVDYGVSGMFGDGVSSVKFPDDQPCKFFSGRNCDWRAGAWDGSFWGQRDVDWFADGPHDANPRYPGLNNKIRSFRCSHSSRNRMKREDLASEAIEEPEERRPEVLEKRADAETTKIASKSPSPNFSGGLANPPTNLHNRSETAHSSAHPTNQNTVASTIQTRTETASDFLLRTCTSRDYVDCYLWAGMYAGECLAGKDNANLAHTKSMLLIEDQQCVLYRNSLGCSGDNVIITRSEPRLDYFPNEGGVTANIENQVGSLMCCVGWSSKEGCNGSCLCDIGVIPQPGSASRRSKAVEATAVEVDSLTARSIGGAADSIIGRPTTPDTTDNGIQTRRILENRSPAPIPTLIPDLIPNPIATTPGLHLTFTACEGKNYKNCTDLYLKTGARNCLSGSDELFSAHSITLPGTMECLLYLNEYCRGPSIHIGRSEPDLDVFGNERGLEAGMGGAVRSIWCCEGPGMGKCVMDV